MAGSAGEQGDRAGGEEEDGSRLWGGDHSGDDEVIEGGAASAEGIPFHGIEAAGIGEREGADAAASDE